LVGNIRACARASLVEQLRLNHPPEITSAPRTSGYPAGGSSPALVQLICAVGAISNVGAAAWLYDYQQNCWLAGLGGSSGGRAEGRMPENHHDCVFIWRAVASHCE
jgi:hypothetical protein